MFLIIKKYFNFLILIFLICNFTYGCVHTHIYICTDTFKNKTCICTLYIQKHIKCTIKLLMFIQLSHRQLIGCHHDLSDIPVGFTVMHMVLRQPKICIFIVCKFVNVTYALYLYTLYTHLSKLKQNTAFVTLITPYPQAVLRVIVINYISQSQLINKKHFFKTLSVHVSFTFFQTYKIPKF